MSKYSSVVSLETNFEGDHLHGIELDEVDELIIQSDKLHATGVKWDRCKVGVEWIIFITCIAERCADISDTSLLPSST
jgi:hypothetical protein